MAAGAGSWHWRIHGKECGLGLLLPCAHCITLVMGRLKISRMLLRRPPCFRQRKAETDGERDSGKVKSETGRIYLEK